MALSGRGKKQNEDTAQASSYNVHVLIALQWDWSFCDWIKNAFFGIVSPSLWRVSTQLQMQEYLHAQFVGKILVL